MSDQIALLTEIRDLLLLLAEPAIAARDSKHRDALKNIVGKSPKKAAAACNMTGNLSQKELAKVVKIDPGALSRFIKQLRASSLLNEQSENPCLAITIPPGFFD